MCSESSWMERSSKRSESLSASQHSWHSSQLKNNGVILMCLVGHLLEWLEFLLSSIESQLIHSTWIVRSSCNISSRICVLCGALENDFQRQFLLAHWCSLGNSCMVVDCSTSNPGPKRWEFTWLHTAKGQQNLDPKWTNSLKVGVYSIYSYPFFHKCRWDQWHPVLKGTAKGTGPGKESSKSNSSTGEGNEGTINCCNRRTWNCAAFHVGIHLMFC